MLTHDLVNIVLPLRRKGRSTPSLGVLIRAFQIAPIKIGAVRRVLAFHFSYISGQHIVSLLDTESSIVIPDVMGQNSELMNMNLYGKYLSSLEPEQFAKVVTRLTKLDLEFVDLSSVDSSFLAKAVARLEDVNLQHTQLSSEQMNNILKHVQKSTRVII